MKVKEKLSTAELDNLIVDSIKNGTASEKEIGFEKLFKKYKNFVMLYLNRGVRFDGEVAKDLMMDVFTKIHLNINNFDSNKSALSTWIINITRNTLIDHKRREKYEVLSIEKLGASNEDADGNTFAFQVEDKSISNDSSEVLVREERATALMNALSRIKRFEVREAVILYYFLDKSYDEISEILNIKESQTKAFLFRGKSELKELLVGVEL